MGIRITCPSCRKLYNLDETLQGKTIRCRECQSAFAVPSPSRPGARDEGSRTTDDRITRSSRPALNAARAAGPDDDKPQRRPAERRAPRESKDSQHSKNLLLILLGVGAGVLVLGGLVIGGVIFVLVGMNKSSDTLGGPVAIGVQEQPPVPVDGKANAAPGPVVRPVADPRPKPPKGAAAAVPAGPFPQPPMEPEAALPAGPVPKEMAADVVQKVKHSTTYLRVILPNGEVAQGSGFFAVERGLVITNAHVVGLLRSSSPPRRVDVVIHSGELGEAKLAGTLLGLDRDNDLAVLRVQGDLSRLPPPLPVASAAGLVETQKVYIFGFPFGAQLGKNITVSTSSISSLRRGDNGALEAVQVNGGISPGNSGGPVTDARGAVVGVSVAVISGTQINFAVPADYIQPLVQRSKNTPLDLTLPPGPLAGNPPPGGAAPSSNLVEDLAALKGTWQSGPVSADEGAGRGTVKLSISPIPGGRGGRIQVEIATGGAGRNTSSKSSYTFTLREDKGQRVLVTNNLGRRGRGMVFIYRFDDGQLVLSGVLASLRSAYTLKNITFRRTAAEPEENVAANPPKPANPSTNRPSAKDNGKGAGPAAVKFSGDVYTFVAEAVKEKRLVDVDIRGFTLHQNTYRDVPEKGALLVGFQVGLGKFTNNDIIKSFRPIYLTKSGAKPGRWIGPVPQTPVVTIKAKSGYVVSGVTVRTALTIDAITVTFAKLDKDGLDMSDTYESKQVGGNGGRVAAIGGTGALFVGVTGHLDHDGAPSSLGLVAVSEKE